MKHPFLRSVVMAACWLALSGVPQAETGTPPVDPFASTPPSDAVVENPGDPTRLIRVQVEFIDVSHEQLTELLCGTQVAANDDELRKQVGQLVKAGKATIVETLLCVAKDRKKGTTESIEEMIYPTEYEPPQLPCGGSNTSKAAADKANPQDTATGPSPSAWETRNVGSTMEIEPTLGDDKQIINLRLIPEIVYHVGNTVWAEWKDEYGNKPIQMPTFYTLRVNTSVVLGVGQTLMMAALSPKNKDGATDFSRKLMIFVKADLLTPGR